MPMRLEPAAPLSQVKYSTTELLRSIVCHLWLCSLVKIIFKNSKTVKSTNSTCAYSAPFPKSRYLYSGSFSWTPSIQGDLAYLLTQHDKELCSLLQLIKNNALKAKHTQKKAFLCTKTKYLFALKTALWKIQFNPRVCL